VLALVEHHPAERPVTLTLERDLLSGVTAGAMPPSRTVAQTITFKANS
jgi:hypothetical protein